MTSNGGCKIFITQLTRTAVSKHIPESNFTLLQARTVIAVIFHLLKRDCENYSYF